MGKKVKIYCLILSSTAISEHHELPRTHHKSGHCAIWLAKNVSFCTETVFLSMLLSIIGFGIILTLDAFVFFSKCRMIMSSVGETGSQTETFEVEDWDSAVICTLASKSCNKCAINCLVWQHSGHQLSLNIKFPENKRCFLSWRQSLCTMTPRNSKRWTNEF